MRGLLLITTAVILIVLGLRSSGSEEPKPANDPTTGQVAPAPPTLDPAQGLSKPEEALAVVPKAPELEPTPEVGAGAGAADDRVELPFVIEDPVAKLGGEPAPAWQANGAERVGIQEASSSIQLGAPAGDSARVAQALIESWFQQDPRALQDSLDADHGTAAAQDQARLAGYFWQAMVGRPEAARDAMQTLAESGSITPAQLEMLQAATEFDQRQVMPQHSGRNDPLARSMRMVLLDANSNRELSASKYKEAATELSELILAEVHAPWAPHKEALAQWAERLNRAQSFYRMNPTGDWPGITYRVQSGESLELIRKRVVDENPGLLMCTGLINKVNHLGKFIHPGDVLRIPTEPASMLVDLDARLAMYMHGGEIVHAWVVGVGREGKDTPIGTYTIGDKLKEPVWTRPGQPALPYGHPDNLLGARWLGWYQDGVKTDYGFHGTNDESGVGGRVSSGCIRMRNADVELLFELLPSGARVVVQP
ncbi:MAG: L,D-transpeptidase family protein [Planctomycetota bacterium]